MPLSLHAIAGPAAKQLSDGRQAQRSSDNHTGTLDLIVLPPVIGGRCDGVNRPLFPELATYRVTPLVEQPCTHRTCVR